MSSPMIMDNENLISKKEHHRFFLCAFLCPIYESSLSLTKHYNKIKFGETQSNSAIPLGNYVYRYELVDNKLINPDLILKLPASPGPIHDGGKVLIGPDKNVYAVIGDLRNHRTQAQNIASGGPPDLTSGIIRVTQDGKPIFNSPLGNTYPLNLYYAYGIRNSFGMDFDPVTGKLWDTGNGPNYC